jgi:hypothetical protein
VQRKALEKLGTIASPNSRPVLTEFIAHNADAILKREARKAITRIDRAQKL